MSWDSDWVNDQADQDWMRRQAEIDDARDDLEHDQDEDGPYYEPESAFLSQRVTR